MESDWKIFSVMAPMLRERYLATRNAQVATILTATDKTDTERFWDAMEVMEKEAKVLRECLDEHSRSKMWLSISSMIAHGMIGKEDAKEFSQELQDEMTHWFSVIEGKHRR